MSDLSRRDLLRRGGTIAGGAAVTTTVGSRAVPRFSPVGRAQAAFPLAPVVGGGYALGYLAKKAYDAYTGDDRDYDAFTGSDALHQELYIGVTEMLQADEQMFTSIQNNIDQADNVALSKGKVAAVEEMNAENPEEDAQQALYDEIDDHFAVIQENIYSHIAQQIRQAHHMMERALSHEAGTLDSKDISFDGNRVINVAITDVVVESTDDIYLREVPVELINGDTFDFPVIGFQTPSDSSGDWRIMPQEWFEPVDDYDGIETDQYLQGDPTEVFGTIANNHGRFQIDAHSDQDGDMIHYYQEGAGNISRFLDTHEALYDQHSSVETELSGFVSDVYAEWSAGDIPTEDILDPITLSTELAQDYDNRAGQGAHAAMLGIPSSAEETIHITVHDEEYGDWEAVCDIFTSYVPTDADGNEIGFESGSTYDPGTWDEPLYIAYDYEGESDFTQLETSFTIESVEDVDGNEIEQFQTEDTNIQTSDVQALKEELEALREQQVKLQEDAQDQDGDGGIGIGLPNFGDLDSGQILVGLAAVTGGAFLLSSDD